MAIKTNDKAVYDAARIRRLTQRYRAAKQIQKRGFSNVEEAADALRRLARCAEIKEESV